MIKAFRMKGRKTSPTEFKLQVLCDRVLCKMTRIRHAAEERKIICTFCDDYYSLKEIFHFISLELSASLAIEHTGRKTRSDSSDFLF